jgi:hypothetical protein
MSTLTEKIVSIKRRQICQRVNNPGTAPTTEHLMLGDWSTSPSARNFKDCTDHRAIDARGLVAQFISSELQRLH